MKRLRLLKLWLTLGWIMVGIVVFLSLTPSPPEIPSIPSADKGLHLIAYLILMLYFGLIYLPGKGYRNVGIGLFAMGLALECLQGLLGYRTAEALDMVCNSLGVIVGAGLARTRLSSGLLRVESLLYPRHKGPAR